MPLVTLQYNDLAAGKDLSAEIFEAFGPGGLGALTVAGIPGFVEQREALLPQAHTLAHSPDDVKASLEHPESMWNAGWSHGKEKMGDVPDFAKGSFYANPLYDQPFSPEEVAKHPYFYPANIWPTDTLPALEPAFKSLGKTMYDVVVLLAAQIDRLTEARVPTYAKGSLHAALSTTKKVKGRLLYYYPCDETEKDDGWIATHNDSGFLTALTSALFVDDATGAPTPNPDPNGGLWIIDRTSGKVKVSIPSDHLAIQCGECLQIVTGGLLVATPHLVRASKAPEGQKIGRATFPVFVDVDAEFPLSAPPDVAREQVFDKTVSSAVPPLEKRWKGNGQPFVEFLGDTFTQYYEWTKQAQGAASS